MLYYCIENILKDRTSQNGRNKKIINEIIENKTTVEEIIRVVISNKINKDILKILTKYGVVKERIAALMTDALRANLLECVGYKTQLLEFINILHSPKNILIRGGKSNIAKAKKEESLLQVQGLIHEFNLKPTLYNLLKNDNIV